MINPDDLLKAATQQHDAGDADTAIETLRLAYKAILQGDVFYGILTFTRLPLYLQKAGRFEEAKKEFTLLLDGATERSKREMAHQSAAIQASSVAMQHSEIYDKIRVAFEREKLFVDASGYNILSMAHRSLGLHLQGRREELEDIQQEDFWQEWTAKTLKKAGLSEKQPEIIKQCLKCVQSPSERKIEDLRQYLDEVLQVSGKLI